MQSKITQGSSLLNGRAFVLKSTTPGAPVELILNPQNEILQEFKIFMGPSTIAAKDTGFKVFVNETQYFPAIGSNEVQSAGTDFTGARSGWASIPSAGVIFESGELNLILSGPPYEVKFQFYNADAANDYYAFVTLRATPKIDLPAAPIQADEKKKD